MKPVISLISAMDQNRLIGTQNTLPWKLSADMAFFKATTMGKPIIMGRKTFDSLTKALPGRHNIIVSRNPDLMIEGCDVVPSLEVAVKTAGDVNEVMIIGGAMLYQLAMPIADQLYITEIHEKYDGDAWFPEIDPEIWVEESREDHAGDEINHISYSFVKYSRR